MLTKLNLAPRETPLIPMSFPLGRRWFVLSVWGREERNVIDEVKKLGMGAWTPMSMHRKRSRQRFVIRHQPLFAGYIFTHFDIERDEWGALYEIDGVLDLLVTAHDIPVRIGDDVIEKLKRAEAAGMFDYTKPSASFREDDTVEIMEGPLAGLIAKVRNVQEHKRVKLLLAALGTLEIDACHLAKIA